MNVVAISPDIPGILKHFAERVGITYPLLSDSDSRIIKSFGILNTTIPENQMFYGIPFPGTYIVDAQGKILSKYFEEEYTQRYTADTILVKEFGSEGDREIEINTEHMKIKAFLSEYAVVPGNRFSMVLDIEIPENMHLYATGAEGYIPVSLKIDPSPDLAIQDPVYPQPEIMYLDVIKERVPVYKGRVRIIRDVILSPQSRATDLVLSGSLHYQACDESFCYLPAQVPLKFELEVIPHDFERVPASVRNRSAGP